MKDKLVLLYALQIVDSQLQELEEQKGDLPDVVNSLQTDLDNLNQQKNDKQIEFDQLRVTREKSDSEVIDFKEKIDKYREQQFHVRNNREYDALTKEIDYALEKITELEQIFLESEGNIEVIGQDIKNLNSKIEEVENILSDKNAELEVVTKENEAEENKLKHQKEKIVVRLNPEIISRFERIKNARHGKAVTSLRKDCCAGCNNRIPPQHILELKLNNELYICGHCGRIIVSQEAASDANHLEIFS